MLVLHTTGTRRVPLFSGSASAVINAGDTDCETAPWMWLSCVMSCYFQQPSHQEAEDNAALDLLTEHVTCMMVLVASIGMRTMRKDAAAAEATRVLKPTFRWAVVS